MKIQNTTITISKSLALKLNKWKYKLEVKTIEEVINKILLIVPADQLEVTK